MRPPRKIVCDVGLTRSKSHTDGPQLFDASVQNFAAQATWRPGNLCTPHKKTKPNKNLPALFTSIADKSVIYRCIVHLDGNIYFISPKEH
jgi:hypothetical protein